MNICYLILAHNAPDMLKRSIDRLRDEHTYFYIHIDQKCDIAPFKAALEGFDNIRFVSDEKRVAAAWGTANALNGIVECMRLATDEHTEGYTVLMSGVDYPIRSKEYIRAFIIENKDTIFIDAEKMPTSFWYKGGIDRISRHWYNLGDRNFVYIDPYKLHKNQLQNFLTILKKRPSLLPEALSLWFVKRKFPQTDFVHYGGSLWFGAPLFSIRTLVDYLNKHPEYLKFHKRSKMPDEIAFNSLLMLDKKANIVTNSTLRFIEWDYDKPEQPTTFTLADKATLSEALQVKENLFARKFSPKRDTNILDWIDKTSIL